MYAVHFVLFVMTLVLCHIMQSCLRPYVKHQEAEQETEEPSEEQTDADKGDESCRWAMWSAWSECTVTCGDGVSVRHRIILIRDNCTGDTVQEKVCSERHCPYDKNFIIQQKDEDFDQSSDDTENKHKSENMKSDSGHGHDGRHGKANKENLDPDESLDYDGGHVTGYTDVPRGDFDSDNDMRHGKNGAHADDAPPNGRTRAQSWTSDDGNTWDRQSSFDSLSHGEEADHCLSDCSPSDRPAKDFGSEESFEKSGNQKEGKSAENENRGTFRESKRSGEYTNEQGDKARFEEKKDKPVEEESFRGDDEHSNNEGNQFDADTDFEGDDNYDDAEDDDAFDDDDVDDGGDGDDKNENESNRKQKNEYDDEEDAEQDDLEQEVDETVTKRRRRKKRRKRRQKLKKGTDEVVETRSRTADEPTDICDTFMAVTENFNSADAATTTELVDETFVSKNTTS